MIAKRVPSKKNTGSFKGLSNYITRQADDKESVPYKITNTNFYSYSSAIKEIEDISIPRLLIEIIIVIKIIR